jgi:DNA-binding Lrp family transcriptional regulator
MENTDEYAAGCHNSSGRKAFARLADIVLKICCCGIEIGLPQMNKLDGELLNLLINDGRMSFADIARQLKISRTHARDRTKAMLESGLIEQFTAVTNPEMLGKTISSFVDIKVAPSVIEIIAEDLASQPEVVSLYIMTDLQSLHIHTLTDSNEAFSQFVSAHLFSNPSILSINSTSLLKRVKHRRGGARL